MEACVISTQTRTGEQSLFALKCSKPFPISAGWSFNIAGFCLFVCFCRAHSYSVGLRANVISSSRSLETPAQFISASLYCDLLLCNKLPPHSAVLNSKTYCLTYIFCMSRIWSGSGFFMKLQSTCWLALPSSKGLQDLLPRLFTLASVPFWLFVPWDLL